MTEAARSGGAALRVLAAGPLTVVVDRGRAGQAHWGVAPSGAFDLAAHAAASSLVGNEPDTATLEVLLGPLVLEATRAVVLAVSGPARVRVGGLEVATDRPFALPAGGRGEIEVVGGARAWDAVAGGIEVPTALGSRSTDTLAGLGPAPLTAGDLLPVGRRLASPAAGLPTGGAGPSTGTAGAGDVVEIPVLPPPRPEVLGPDAWAQLCRTEWTVSAQCDRVAVRLDGPAIEAPEASAPSEGLVRGAIQLPPSGRPLVFGPDHPLTGGYPVVGVATSTGLSVLAQVVPGVRARFVG